MSNGMFINLLILCLMSLCGVVLGGILWEIRKVRERLHKVEGGHEHMLSTLEFVKGLLADLKDVHVRLVKLEATKHR